MSVPMSKIPTSKGKLHGELELDGDWKDECSDHIVE